MNRYPKEEAEKLVKELQDSKNALTSNDTRWFRRVHAEITQFAIENKIVERFWALEDLYKNRRISEKDYYEHLILFLCFESSFPLDLSDRN
jgi:hypothetical protein